MIFEVQPITIKTRTGDMTFEAKVAQGTGLAYHRHIAPQGKFTKFYGVTILSTGLTMSLHIQFTTAEETERFIEQIAPLANWTASREELGQLLPELKAKVMSIYQQMKEEVPT